MKAISARYGVPEATMGAIAAGCDAVLMCGTSQEPQHAALEGLIRAMEQGALPISASRMPSRAIAGSRNGFLPRRARVRWPARHFARRSAATNIRR